MNDERKMILQMVADGKITPEQADKLMQAIDETEQTAHSAATEGVHSSNPGTARGTGAAFVTDIGETIERAVSESLRGLDDTMRSLEFSLDRRLGEQARGDLRRKIEDKLRRSAERAVEQARAAQERAERAAQRATRRAAEHAGRAADRMEQRLANRPETIIRAGISIDREKVQQREQLAIPAEPGDLLLVDNRIGDVSVAFYPGSVVEVDALMTVWGADRADAEARAAATKVELVRRGATVDLMIRRPNVVGVGLLVTKNNQVDYTIRVPFGMHLRIHSKVGDLKILSGPQVGSWELETKVGDIDVTVPPDAGFRYELSSSVGCVIVPTGDGGSGVGLSRNGRVGDGSGFIDGIVKTGDIRIHIG